MILEMCQRAPCSQGTVFGHSKIHGPRSTVQATIPGNDAHLLRIFHTSAGHDTEHSEEVSGDGQHAANSVHVNDHVHCHTRQRRRVVPVSDSRVQKVLEVATAVGVDKNPTDAPLEFAEAVSVTEAPPGFLVLYRTSVCDGALPPNYEEAFCPREVPVSLAAEEQEEKVAQVTNMQAWVWLSERRNLRVQEARPNARKVEDTERTRCWRRFSPTRPP